MKKINICIVHYNTPYLTECLVKSINKHVGYNCNIYIFDNSDKHPFVYKQDNITLFDNTKGQIINFDKWLEKYPNKTLDAKRNGYGSAKHCYTVEKCFDLLNVDEFILMDSDILLKQDVRNIYNNENIFAAEILKQNNKIIEKAAPFLCYINVKKCKEVGVHYFNENYMFGLHKTDINPKCDYYDTGAWFYFDAKKYQYKTFKLDDYIVHYGSASWKTNNTKEWLLKHKNLYDNENIIISFTTYKNRVKYAPEVIKSLLNQTIKPYKICLTLYKEDLQYITPELQYFFDNGDVELLISDVDIAPHKKYYYSMKKYKNYPIVTVDDDVIYDSTLIETLYNGYLRNNMCISAGRTHKIKYNTHGTPLPYNQWQYEYKGNELEPSFDIFATGIGGVLYPPNILQIDDISIEDIMKCLYADDVFLKKRENDLKIKVQWIRGNKILMGKSINIPEVQNTGLALINNLKSRNDEYIKNIGLCKVNEINKKVIYTCITGNYENLVDPSVVSEDFDYVCFTDNLNLSTNVWKLRPIPDELLHLSKIKQQRCIKICPHKYLSEYETSVWIDACIDIIGNINQLLKQDCSDIDKSIFIPKHPGRNCVYEEIKACLHFKKDILENMEPQIKKYKSENYPINNGMVQTGIMIRKHNEQRCIEVMELWKDELVKYSHRDQLSFNYALWKTNNHKTFKYLDKSLFNSKYFNCYYAHNRKSNNANKQNNTKNVDSFNLVDVLYNK